MKAIGFKIQIGWFLYYVLVSSTAIYHLGWWAFLYCILMAIHIRESK